MENVLHATNCLPDTGAQLNLVAMSLFSASWMEEVRDERRFNSCFTTNDSIVTLRQIEHYLGLGYLRARNIFIVVEALSINILIGTDFMGKYFTGIYRKKNSSSHFV